ncbi:glycosyltransferase family 39 protein [Thermocrinis sp.]|uniref:ArnT family glycosyltransferase n=1 Tax=Thermocrinis sp. TaxID=2024383 RepID=UPI002FDEDE52
MLFLISFFFFVFGNWLLSLTSLDEGRNAYAVFNMLNSGNILVPYYNCDVRFEKPPMLYYAGLISAKLFGLNEFSLRLVSGLSAVGLGTFTYFIAKLYFGEETAKKAFLILATLPHLWVESRAFVPEMLLNFFMAGALYFFLIDRKLLGWTFLSLAFLTKGPVGVFLPLSAYIILKKNLRFMDLKGVALFLILGGSWYYLMLFKFGLEYFYKFFLYENLMRYTGHRLTHPYPFYYYLFVLLIAFFFYLPAIPRIAKNMNKQTIPFLLWGAFVLLFFSLAKNKLHHYILFSYPAFAVFSAYHLSYKYIRNTLVIGGLFLTGLLFISHFYEKDRFQTKALQVLKSFRGPVYFYRGAEISPIPFYLQKCIPKIDELPAEEALVISKEEIRSCQMLLAGRELDGNYRLYLCNP